MKEIQEIMLEMDNLSNQIATTLNEEEQTAEAKLTPPPKSQEETEVEELATKAAAIPQCGSPCPPPPNRRVNFCCILDIPSNLGLIPADFLRMVYSTDCLRCVVEPCTTSTTVCNCPVTVTVYNVKIVGCIPFLVNHAFGSTECFSNPDFLMDLCCHDSVCVDNIICTKCNQADADAACNIIRNKFSTCSCTPVTFNAVTNLFCNNILKGLQISGFFTLPNCSTPIRGNCNP